MKNTDIAKLRTKIKRAIEILHRPVEYDLEADALLVQALALLPCETCGGTGKKPEYAKVCPECGCPDFKNENLIGKGYRQCSHCHQDWWIDVKYAIGDDPCPDCQS